MRAAAVVIVVVILGGLLAACNQGESSPVPGSGAAAMEQASMTPGTTATTASGGASPTAPAVPSAGVSHGKLTVASTARAYRLFVPKSVAAQPDNKIALVVVLHGGLGSGDQVAENTRFDALAEQERFIVVYPDGLNRTWNAGRCCGQAASQNVDDVGYLSALIADLTARLPVDPHRVFMTGHSNGAMMSFRFACERADLIAAVAPVSGSLEIPDCRPSRGIPLLNIHGDSDKNVPFNGGRGSRSIADVSFTSQAETMARWTSALGCQGAPVVTRAGALTHNVWGGCRDGVTAELLVIAGADHPWPGASRASSPLGGTPSQALDATRAAWDFFRKATG